MNGNKEYIFPVDTDKTTTLVFVPSPVVNTRVEEQLPPQETHGIVIPFIL